MKRFCILFIFYSLCANALTLPTIDKVLAALTLPQTGQKIVLVQSERGIDFYVFQGERLKLFKGNIITGQAIPGEQPGLRMNDKGEVLIHSQSQKRRRFNQTLTMSVKNNNYLITKFTYAYQEQIKKKPPQFKGEYCQINLLTGLVNVNEKRFKLKTRAIPIKRWSNNLPSSVCGFN